MPSATCNGWSIRPWTKPRTRSGPRTPKSSRPWTTLQQHLGDTADRALAFVACSTSATETHAALLQNRIDAYASNPNETTYAQFLDAAIEGGNSYLLNMRDCNEPSRILAYGVEEAQYQCAAANHVIMEGARIVRDSQDPVYDLDRIFEPGTTRTQDMLSACLDAPGRFLVELATFAGVQRGIRPVRPRLLRRPGRLGLHGRPRPAARS